MPSQYNNVFRNILTINIGHVNKRRQPDGFAIHMEYLVAELWTKFYTQNPHDFSLQSVALSNLFMPRIWNMMLTAGS